MAAEHHQRLTGFQLADQLDQGTFALIVQIGVGFVQHHVHRIAIHRPRYRQTLFLASGQGVARFAQFGFIPLGEGQNSLVHANGFGSGHHFVRVDRPQAGNVLGHRALKQFDILRHVADVLAQIIADPRGNFSTIQPHMATCRLPQPHQQLDERGFACGARAHQSQHLARLGLEIEVEHNRALGGGGLSNQLRHVQRSLGRGQRHTLRHHIILGHHRIQAFQRLFGRLDAGPTAHNLFDRANRAVQQKAGRNDHTSGNHPFNRQKTRQRHLQRRHGMAQETGSTADQPCRFTGIDLQAQKMLVLFKPAPPNIALHTQGQRRVGLAQTLCGQTLGLCRRSIGFAQRRRGNTAGGIGSEQLDDGRHENKDGQIRVKRPANENKDDGVGRAHECQQRTTGQELTQRHHITQHLVYVHVLARHVTPERGVKHPCGNVPVDAQRNADHHARAHPLQPRPETVGQHHQRRQRHQRDLAAAGNHAVEHVPHVHDWCNRKHLNHEREYGHEHKRLLALSQQVGHRVGTGLARGVGVQKTVNQSWHTTYLCFQ